MPYLEMLTRYKAWANALFYECVSELSYEQLTAPQPIAFGSLIHTLNHSYLMDFVWKSHLVGTEHGLDTRNPEETHNFQRLRHEQELIDIWFVEFAKSLSEEKADGAIEFNFIGGGDGRMTRRDIILHVVNHTTYHRGHAADILYHFNVMPPTTDLPVFIRQLGSGT